MANNRALPTRFDDIEFFPSDKLDVRFTLRTDSGNPINVSNSNFDVTVTSNNNSDVPQPIIDLGDAENGYLWIRWTPQQVETLPPFFTVEVAESAAFEVLGESTWDAFSPTVAWDDFPDFTWESASIWDRTILVGRFIRNTYGRYE